MKILDRSNVKIEIIPQKVKFIEESLNGDEEKLVYLTAIQSRANGMAYNEELPTLKKQREVIKRVLGYGHESICEVRGAMFNVTTSRPCAQQLLRHRFINPCQQSQRYVGYNDTYTFIAPKNILENVDALDAYRERLYSGVVNYIDYYNELVTGPFKKSRNPEQAAQEQARDLLPQSVASSIVFNANFRQLRHFFRLRTCRRAQTPIREMSWEMLSVMKRKVPSVFEGIGPSCSELGYCNDADRCYGVPSLNHLRCGDIR